MSNSPTKTPPKQKRIFLNLPKNIDLRGDEELYRHLKNINRKYRHRTLAHTLLFLAKQAVQNGLDS